MLNIDPDKVCFVVVRMRELEEEELIEDEEAAAEEVDLDHEEAFDELETHGEEEEPLRAELVTFLETLSEEEQIELVALAWLGRGDFDVEEWEDAVEAASDRHNDRTAQYLIGMPRLPDYLEEGLAAFSLSCTEFDESRL